jgi:CDP-glucose 4,6-dehydratase
MDKEFWKGKNVLITGHTGFKGSWLSLVLQHMGAKVTGYALPPAHCPNLFELANVADGMTSLDGDIRDFDHLISIIKEQKPQIVFHLAAQAIVRRSYQNPIETFSTNVMGTANILEAVRQSVHTEAIVNVTSDKCYENQEWVWRCRESDLLGGVDPYSSSKACSELITSTFRRSFFTRGNTSEPDVRVATARAGNVIGGGDWSQDRVVPDCFRAWMNSDTVMIRFPNAIRPWQHVLEPLYGYLQLAKMLYEGEGESEGAWNFGPSDNNIHTVLDVVEKLASFWEGQADWQLDQASNPEEAYSLKLDCSKAKIKLGWSLIWDLETSIKRTVEWYATYLSTPDVIREKTVEQISKYFSIPQ